MSSSDIENLQTKLSRFNIKQLRAYVKNNKLNIKDRSSEGLRKKIIKASQRKNNNLTHKYQVVAVASGFETPPQKTTNYNSPKKTIQIISDEKIHKKPGCYRKVAKNLQHVEGFHNLPKPIEKLPIYKPTKTVFKKTAINNKKQSHLILLLCLGICLGICISSIPVVLKNKSTELIAIDKSFKQFDNVTFEMYNIINTIMNKIYMFCVKNPAHDIYINSYWLGLPESNICSQLAGTDSGFFDVESHNKEQCYNMIQRRLLRIEMLIKYSWTISIIIFIIFTLPNLIRYFIEKRITYSKSIEDNNKFNTLIKALQA
tara:strand:- start:14503 stop:15447 length:945 start_codon:yes stop_codon:yes gene_type:complete